MFVCTETVLVVDSETYLNNFTLELRVQIEHVIELARVFWRKPLRCNVRTSRSECEIHRFLMWGGLVGVAFYLQSGYRETTRANVLKEDAEVDTFSLSVVVLEASEICFTFGRNIIDSSP